MLFKEKKNDFNFADEKNLKSKMKQSSFVFSYSYGLLSEEKTNFTRLIVLDKEVMVKKSFDDTTKNIDKTFEKADQAKKIREYFSQKGVLNQLKTISNIPKEDLKLYKNSRIDNIYLKINDKVYNFDGNSANLEYRKFLEKIIKKVYAILNIDYIYSNKKYKVSLNAPASWTEYDATEYGHPIFKFRTINIPKTEVLFKFYGIVSFSPALYGQYTVERIGVGTADEYNDAFNNFIKFVSAEDNNYRLIKKEKIDFKNRIINRAFINYINSNITSIVDYVYIDGNIIVIGCPLCLNMTDEEALNSKNIELNNHIIQTIRILGKVDRSKEKVKIIDHLVKKIDEKIEEINRVNLSKEQIKEMVSNADYVFNYTYGTFSPNNKKYKTLTLVDDYIIIDENGNNFIEKNKEKTDKMWFDVNMFMDAIMKCSSETKEIPHIKDSSKDEITLKVEDKSYLFSNKINDKKYNTMYLNIVNGVLRHLDDKDKIQEYENLKQKDHLLIQSWFGKNQIGIDERLVTFEKNNLGYVYEFHKKSGFDNKLVNRTIINKCKLDPILLLDLKKYIDEELKIFDKEIKDKTSLDRGTKISIKLDGKSIIINNSDEYYIKLSNKINELLRENDEKIKEIIRKLGPDKKENNEIVNSHNSDENLLNISDLNQKFKDAKKSFFYIYGSVANKNYKIIKLVENYVIKEEFINGKDHSKIVQDNDISMKAWNVIDSRLDEIKRCSDEIQNSKRIIDGNNDSIIVKDNGNSYGFSPKVDNENIKNIYDEISTEILKYLDI